jgi:hypothetical protein
LLAAYNGIDQVPAEVKDLSIAEVVELVGACLPEILKLVEAIRK